MSSSSRSRLLPNQLTLHLQREDADYNFCKLEDIYIDPQSSQQIELGTLEYPYRTMKSVSAEILSLWSNSDKNVTVFMKDVYLEE